MCFLSYYLSLTWILIGFWGRVAIEIAVTQNVIANSILSKPFIRKATSAFELSCSYLVFNARTHFPAYV